METIEIAMNIKARLELEILNINPKTEEYTKKQHTVNRLIDFISNARLAAENLSLMQEVEKLKKVQEMENK
jgi:hypothetical protein